MSVLHDMASAVRLLTRLPVPGAEGERPAAYFPLVGWLFVALAAALVWGASALGRTHGVAAMLVSALVLGAWALLSGALHWDGLADTADGMGVRGDAERRLVVMRDSTIGAYGVIAIVLVALVQVSALATVIDAGAWWALGAPVVARFAATVTLWTRRQARSDGLGAHYRERPTVAGILIAAVTLMPLAVVPLPTAPVRIGAVAACALLGALTPGLFVRRLGGITGDVIGATVVLTETLVLVAGALAGGGA